MIWGSWFQHVKVHYDGDCMSEGHRHDSWNWGQGLTSQTINRKQRWQTGMSYGLWNLKICSQWHTTSIKAIQPKLPKQHHQLGTKYPNVQECVDISFNYHRWVLLLLLFICLFLDLVCKYFVNNFCTHIHSEIFLIFFSCGCCLVSWC